MNNSNSKMKKSNRKPLGRRLALWGILVVVLFAVGLVIGQLKSRDAKNDLSSVDVPVSQITRDVLLYFASHDGQTLVAETATIKECEQDEDCLRDTVQALIAGSNSGLAPILPSQTALLGINVDGSLIKLDFSQDLITAHPGGTQSELLTIYGLADTLAANFPHLRQVQIVIEGVPAETLKGHVDLRQPIYPDFSFVEEGEAPIGKMDSDASGRTE